MYDSCSIWCVPGKWMEMCVTGSLCLFILLLLLAGWQSSSFRCNSHSQSTGTASAISISIPNSKQLPIVYLFLQLVVDFPSGLMVLVAPPIYRFPLRLHEFINCHTSLISSRRTEVCSVETVPSLNFPWPLRQSALYLRRLLISLMTIDDRKRL